MGFGVLLLRSHSRSRGGFARGFNWPVAEGLVASSAVREHFYFDQGSHLSRSSFEPMVEYVYAVSGREYGGTQVSYGPPMKSRADAEEAIAHFAPGSSLKIRYNPDNPGEEVIEPTIPQSGCLRGAGIAFLLLGLLSLGISLLLLFLPSAL